MMLNNTIITCFIIFFVTMIFICTALFFYQLGKATGESELQETIAEHLEHDRKLKIEDDNTIYTVEVIHLERKWTK